MKIAIIDIDSVCFTIGNPNKIFDEQGNPKRTEDNSKFLYIDKTNEELLASMNFVMQDILLSGNFTHYIGYIKGVSTTNDRKAINTEYKQNRPTSSPSWWKFVKEALIAKWGVIQVDNIEVDDACRITSQNLANSHIVAIDGDLLGLESINPHFNWRKKEWVTVTKEEAEYKFWCDMIVGQPGDNLKGIPGKGIKYAEGLKQTADLINVSFNTLVYRAYIEHFGEYKGIQEFYKNYMCLYILREKEGFEIPKIIEFNENTSEKETTTRTDN